MTGDVRERIERRRAMDVKVRGAVVLDAARFGASGAGAGLARARRRRDVELVSSETGTPISVIAADVALATFGTTQQNPAFGPARNRFALTRHLDDWIPGIQTVLELPIV